MKEEIQKALNMVSNPMADGGQLRELKEKLSWYNTTTLTPNEKEAFRVIFQ